MKDTKKNFNKVMKLAERYMLPDSYEPYPEKQLNLCYWYVVAMTGDNPTDEELFQLVDEYFNL
jgi:phenylalanyl-tRNA synthetase beta subunit